MGMGVTMDNQNVHFKFYIECEIEFDSLGLKYKYFNISLIHSY